MVHTYTTEKTIHQFAIGYMIKPSLRINRMLREKFQKCLGCYLSIESMKTIRDFLMKNNTYVMALIMINKTGGKHNKSVQIVKLCCLYSHRQLCLC